MKRFIKINIGSGDRWVRTIIDVEDIKEVSDETGERWSSVLTTTDGARHLLQEHIEVIFDLIRKS